MGTNELEPLTSRTRILWVIKGNTRFIGLFYHLH
jgi:hypothetical protein